MGKAGLGMRDSMRMIERLRQRLERMRDDVGRAIGVYHTPTVTVGPRHKLYMSDMVDDIAKVSQLSPPIPFNPLIHKVAKNGNVE